MEPTPAEPDEQPEDEVEPSEIGPGRSVNQRLRGTPDDPTAGSCCAAGDSTRTEDPQLAPTADSSADDYRPL